MKSSHFFLLLFFMLSKVFAFKVNETCTNKNNIPITIGNIIQWDTNQLGTKTLGLNLEGQVQAVGSFRITKPDESDIPNAWYVYWDTPTWVNGYFSELFDPTVKDPPKWTGEDSFLYVNPYNEINVPSAQIIGINMDLYTDCFTDQATKELNCNKCNVFVNSITPPASDYARERVDYSEPWLSKLLKKQG